MQAIGDRNSLKKFGFRVSGLPLAKRLRSGVRIWPGEEVRLEYARSPKKRETVRQYEGGPWRRTPHCQVFYLTANYLTANPELVLALMYRFTPRRIPIAFARRAHFADKAGERGQRRCVDAGARTLILNNFLDYASSLPSISRSHFPKSSARFES